VRTGVFASDYEMLLCFLEICVSVGIMLGKINEDNNKDVANECVIISSCSFIKKINQPILERAELTLSTIKMRDTYKF
jgi:hypothetical protein